MIGLPRSGTSLVHKLVHEQTERLAPTFLQFGVDVSRVPARVRELNKCFDGEQSLAEDNDFPGTLEEYRAWLERRGDKWVCKSPDHIGRLADVWDVFPEARFLWCLRPAGATLASIREYYQVTGVGPAYDIRKAVYDGEAMVDAFPEKFDCIWTPSIPEFESDREGVMNNEAESIDYWQGRIRGLCRNVSSRDFARLYS